MSNFSTPEKSGEVLHFVKESFGRLGCEWINRDPADMSRTTVVRDILSGDIAHPVKILEACEEGPIFRDITEDVAREVYQKLQDAAEACPTRLRDFLDIELGACAADQLDISTGHFSVDRTAHRIRLAAAE